MVDILKKDFNTSCLVAEHLASIHCDDSLEFWLDVEFFKRYALLFKWRDLKKEKEIDEKKEVDDEV